MKRLEGLEDKVLPLEVGDVLPTDAYTNQATFKKLFRLALATGKGTPEQTLEQYDLGLKLRDTGNDIDLENSEYERLKDCVRQNPNQLASHFLAQLLKKLS